MGYEPYGKTKAILDRAMEHIRSVPYKVSARWGFYRLLQEGFYSKKSDYQKFISLTSRARKSWYDGWTPETLADDTRSMDIFPANGEQPDPDLDKLIEDEIDFANDEIEYHRDQAENYVHDFEYQVDPNFMQDRFCVVMYEARAMHQQFQYYTRGLTLCPFGGQPSIPYKWAIAKYIEQECEKYQKSALVFFFGDLDDAGFCIFEAGRTDITEWCKSDIEFIRCGLTQEQATKYGIPENFEHPRSYQWEALSDEQAKEIITQGIGQHYDFDAPATARVKSQEISDYVNQAVNSDIGGFSG